MALSDLCVFRCGAYDQTSKPKTKPQNGLYTWKLCTGSAEPRRSNLNQGTRRYHATFEILESWWNEDNNGTFHELLCDNSDVHVFHSCKFCFGGSLMLDKRAFVIGMGMWWITSTQWTQCICLSLHPPRSATNKRIILEQCLIASQTHFSKFHSTKIHE